LLSSEFSTESNVTIEKDVSMNNASDTEEDDDEEEQDNINDNAGNSVISFSTRYFLLLSVSV